MAQNQLSPMIAAKIASILESSKEKIQQSSKPAENSKGQDQVQKEVERLEAKIQSMTEESLEVKGTYKTEMDELKRQLEAEKSMTAKTTQDMVADMDRLREMVAPLEVWARIILPDASSAQNQKAPAASSAANKKIVKSAAAWRVDGKQCICATGAAPNNAANNAVPMKQRRGATPNSSSSFKYDRVFGPTSTNSDVYDALSVHVPLGIESKHLIIFMYGRSGTGKSQTLMHDYKPPKSASNTTSQPPLIKTVITDAFKRACDRFDGVKAQITCLEYRCKCFYDLGAEKGVRKQKAICIIYQQSSDRFKLRDQPAGYDPIRRTFTSAQAAVSYIQASDHRRESSKTGENNNSSRGHTWYEVRMCRDSKKKGEDGQEHDMDEDADLGVYTFFDLGGLEQLDSALQGTDKKGDSATTESNSLNNALKALNRPFKAIAARETDWVAQDKEQDNNMFVPSITKQLKGTGPYEKFGRPHIIILGQVNGYAERKEESKGVLETLQDWRTLR